MGVQQLSGPAPVSKTRITKPMSETRRIRKPLMEKKRRERINTCLEDLAAMLTEAQLVKAEPGGKANNKLEKADILELTVKHLKSIKKQTNASIEEDPSPTATCTGRYLEGFNKCMGVVDETLSATGKAELREKVLSHLESCKETLVIPYGAKDGVIKGSTALKDSPVDQCSNESSKSQSPPMLDISKVTRPTSFTLVPTRLPSGGVAFILQGPNIDTDLLLPKHVGQHTDDASNVLTAPAAAPATTASPYLRSPSPTEETPPTPVSSPSPPHSGTPPPSLHSSDEEEMDTSDGDYATDDEDDEVIDVVHIASAGPYDLSTRRMWRPW